MSKKKDVGDRLRVVFDGEIFEKVKEVIKEFAEADKLDDLLDYHYWTDETFIEVEIPVVIKKSKRETICNRKYFVEMNITIEEVY